MARLPPPPGSAVLQLASTDCDDVALKDCLAKVQLSVSQYCSATLQPSMPVALDGSYCESQRGVQTRGERRQTAARAPAMHVMNHADSHLRPAATAASFRTGAIAGKYSKGRSDLEWSVANAGGAISLAMRGRIVPDAGGRETQADCSLTYTVGTAGMCCTCDCTCECTHASVCACSSCVRSTLFYCHPH